MQLPKPSPILHHGVVVHRRGSFSRHRGLKLPLRSIYRIQGASIQAGVPFDLFVELVDVHGNTAPAENVELMGGTFVALEASSSGRGFW